MIDLLEKFENKTAEIIFEWKDSLTEAEGWLVINSLRGGASGGGTRMRMGLNKEEVLSLAKIMEVKFTVSGPKIGGAKSGINFDPKDPRKKDVMKRWFKAIFPILKNYYGTGGDLNIDEITEVIPLTKNLGLKHPSEGIVSGHFSDSDEKKTIIKNLQKGVLKKVVNSKFSPDKKVYHTISDLITGYSVSESVKYFYEIYGGQIKNKKAIIQGWGNVGASAAYYLSKLGVKIIGIIDKYSGIINENGLTEIEIQKLLLNKKNNQLNSNKSLSYSIVNSKIWSLGANIFIPAAASRLVEMSNINNLINNGLNVISCGANIPFKEKKIFYGEVTEYLDERIFLIPDFVANSGMARVFSYLMKKNPIINDESIFSDVSKTIKSTMLKSFEQNKKKNYFTKTSLQIAINELI